MLYRFVDEQKAEGFPTERICDVAGVSTSAYYDWKRRRDGVVGADVLRERLLVAKIRQIHRKSKGTYGSSRITVELHDQGRVINHKRVERLMRIHGIVGYTPKKRTVTTIPYAAHRIPDLVRRDFTPDRLDVTWVGDISYIRTWEGFLYLAVVEDLASRRIVGLSMASHMRAGLVGDALREAVGTRGGNVDGVIFHSDRGSQYTSGEYGDLCAAYRVTQSVGRTGVCWDNAPVESFFATLKKELVHRTTFRTRAEARLAIRHWIESWYNRQRRSSVIGYLSPTNGRTATVTTPKPLPHNHRVRPAGGTPVDRTGLGDTVVVAGSYEVTPALAGVRVGSTGQYEDSTTWGASAGYWVRPHPDFVWTQSSLSTR